MICNHCGYDKIKPNQKTCPICGKKIIFEEQVATQTAPPVTNPQKPELSDVEPGTQPPLADLSPKLDRLAYVMVECPRCGTRMQEDNNFCPRCGYNIRLQKENEEETGIVSDPIEEDNKSQEQSVLEESVTHTPENFRDENPDEYIENGSYQPWPGEEPVEDPVVMSEQANSSSWLLMAVCGIVSILLGWLLYITIKS